MPVQDAPVALRLYNGETTDDRDEPVATLSFADALADRGPADRGLASEADEAASRLLREATHVARQLGCDVRRRCLGGAGGGYRWLRGRMRIVLDLDASPECRLSLIADALRGEPRLLHTPMSDALSRYLRPLRAA